MQPEANEWKCYLPRGGRTEFTVEIDYSPVPTDQEFRRPNSTQVTTIPPIKNVKPYIFANLPIYR